MSLTNDELRAVIADCRAWPAHIVTTAWVRGRYEHFAPERLVEFLSKQELLECG